VLIRFLQAGQPATTTPRPPCAADGAVIQVFKDGLDERGKE
jgi:hypothetical protein